MNDGACVSSPSRPFPHHRALLADAYEASQGQQGRNHSKGSNVTGTNWTRLGAVRGKCML
eukprot:9285484-Alexandrium_andersonii.AAC.1